MKRVTLIKLGGSLITDKSKEYSFREEVVRNIARQIARAKQELPDLEVIIGNGAGSFGHTSAKKYGTASGLINHDSRVGLGLVQADAVELNTMVVRIFLQEKLPVFAIHPSSFVSKNRQIDYDNSMVDRALAMGLIPFVHGDVILDTQQGCGILSTDTIMDLICEAMVTDKKCGVDKVLCVGDYDGIMDNTGKLVEHVTKDNLDVVLSYLYETDRVDVTGGMKKKLQEIVSIAKKGIPSVIFNGLAKDNVYNALTGRKIYSTNINDFSHT